MSSSPRFENNWAVVVGINAYENGIAPLDTAANDARRLAQTLIEHHSYEVHLLVDEAATLSALTDLFTVQLPAEVGENDRVLFYYAGHGVALDGDEGPNGYLLPQDARRGEEDTYLDMPLLHDALTSLPCRHMMVILDSCFSGAFRWSSTRDVQRVPRVIHKERYDRFITDPAWQVLTSASHDQKALDKLTRGALGTRPGAHGHSPFALALFEGLEGKADIMPPDGGDGVITATELYLYLENQLQTATIEIGMRQTPGLWPLKKHDKGEFIFLSPHHELNLPPAPPLTFDSNPYLGLKSYDQDDAPLFFGRDDAIAELSERIHNQALTVVLGASGTGKSSVVKAGLLPKLASDTEQSYHVLPVIRPGQAPSRELASAVYKLNEENTGAIGQLDAASRLEQVDAHIGRWLEDHPGARLVLVVDQLEELVTMTQSSDERKAFLEFLDHLVATRSENMRVILTLRTDFEPQFADSALRNRWEASRYVVQPMTIEEFREVIEGPAGVRVLYFNPSDLADRLVNEVIQTPGALPLLSFALSEMYINYVSRKSDDRALTEEDYESVGGVVGSLRTRANEEYDKLDAAHRETMRRVMLRMVVDEGGNLARRRVAKSELTYGDSEEDARVQTVVKNLSAARLVVEGSDEGGEPYVEPAHDALVRAWGRLIEWIRDLRDDLADLPFQHRMARAAQEWERLDTPKAKRGVLWKDAARSAVLRQLVRHEGSWMNGIERLFAKKSIWSRRVSRMILFGTLAIMAGAGYFITRQMQDLDIAETNLDLQFSRASYIEDVQEYRNRIQAARSEVDPVAKGLFLEEASEVGSFGDSKWVGEIFQFEAGVERLSGWPVAHLWDDQTYDASDRRQASGSVDLLRASDSPAAALELVNTATSSRLMLRWESEEISQDRPQVMDAHFSPDESRVFGVFSDGRVRVWDVAQGHASRPLVLSASGARLTHVATDAAGVRVAALTDNNVPAIWEIGTDEAGLTASTTLRINVGEGDVISVAVAASGRGVSFGTTEGIAGLWRDDSTFTTKDFRAVIEDPSSFAISSLAVNHAGNAVFLGLESGGVLRLRDWNVSTFRQLGACEAEPVRELILSPDESILAAACDSTVEYWQPTGTIPPIILESGEVDKMRFVQWVGVLPWDGYHLITQTTNPRDAKGWAVVRPIFVNWANAFSPIISAHALLENQIHAYRLDPLEAIELEDSLVTDEIVWLEDSLVTELPSELDSLSIWRLHSPTAVVGIGQDGTRSKWNKDSLQVLPFSPGATDWVVGDKGPIDVVVDDTTVILFDVASQTQLKAYSFDAPVAKAWFGSSRSAPLPETPHLTGAERAGARLIVLTEDHALYVIQPLEQMLPVKPELITFFGDLRGPFHFGEAPVEVAVSDDGLALLAIDVDQRMKVWRGDHVRHIMNEGEQPNVEWAAFGPDADYLFFMPAGKDTAQVARVPEAYSLGAVQPLEVMSDFNTNVEVGPLPAPRPIIRVDELAGMEPADWHIEYLDVWEQDRHKSYRPDSDAMLTPAYIVAAWPDRWSLWPLTRSDEGWGVDFSRSASGEGAFVELNIAPNRLKFVVITGNREDASFEYDPILFDAATLKPLRQLSGHKSLVSNVFFGPANNLVYRDGRMDDTLVTFDCSGRGILWNSAGIGVPRVVELGDAAAAPDTSCSSAPVLGFFYVERLGYSELEAYRAYTLQVINQEGRSWVWPISWRPTVYRVLDRIDVCLTPEHRARHELAGTRWNSTERYDACMDDLRSKALWHPGPRGSVQP